MHGLGGTTKNQLFKEAKSGSQSISTTKEFAQKFAPSSMWLYLPVNVLDEPDDIMKAPEIPGTLQIHRLKDVLTDRKFLTLSISSFQWKKILTLLNFTEIILTPSM